ncbi:MAG: restriction endonuclease subunit S [Clostridiales bacterium]|jgi:type I restriction enzyme S subunit|nr:restriction endonuclease subunit S [Clostridiales bacterium]
MMSKLDTLIQELCPNGVEFKRLGEICEYRSSGVDKKTVEGQKAVMLLNYMDVYRNPKITKSIIKMQVTASDAQIANCDIKKGDIFITPSSETIDDIGHSAVATEDIDRGVYSYHIVRFRIKNQKVVLPFFLSYLFRSYTIQSQILQKATGLTRFGLSKERWGNLSIPVPPIEIQCEIVQVLDKFTELTAELTAELSARKQQYNYYLNNLLSFDKTLDSNFDGDTILGQDRTARILAEMIEYIQPTQYIVSSTEYSDEYATPVLTAGQSFILGYTNETDGIYKASKEKPVIIFDDFTTSFHWVDFDFKVKSSALKILTPKDTAKYDFRYLYYAMSCIDYKPDTHARQWIQTYSQFAIHLPSIYIQQYIVSILDKFDNLTNSLQQGLPAEISARQAQYQYYRDKLLSFDEQIMNGGGKS